MKKKVVGILLCCMVTFGLIACGGNKETTDTSTKQEEITSGQNSNEKIVDGVRFTIGAISKEDIKGDMNSNGTMNIESGEYFQFGVDSKKAADYEYIIINVKVENTTDKVVKLFQTGWNATMKDGYELKNIKVTDKLNNEQVPSNYSFEAQAKIPVEKSLNASEVELKYNLKDYSNVLKAMQEAAKGKTKDDIKKEYPELYKDNYVEFGTIKI